jgi:hypothetical protein
MILCIQIKELGEQLSLISPLIDLYKKGDATFPDKVISWLEKTEKTMSQMHLPEGSEMSSLRAKILKNNDILRLGSDKPTRSELRKSRNAEASSSLERGEEILRVRLSMSEERLTEFENKLCEGITALLLENTLPQNQGDYTQWIKQIWELLAQQESTKALTIYLSASLSSFDRSYILDKVITRVCE